MRRGCADTRSYTRENASALGEERSLRIYVVSLAAVLAIACSAQPAPLVVSPSPSRAGPTGDIVAIRATTASAPAGGGAAVEVEVRSDIPFPVRNEITVLVVGSHEFTLSRYGQDGDLHHLIFTLTFAEFMGVTDGDHVFVQYGRGEQPTRWDLGVLRKPALLDPSAPLFFDGITQPGRRAGQALVVLHTLPGVMCEAVFLWPGMPAGGQRIPSTTTDATGTAVFRWSVDPATPPGSWRIDATCGGRTVSTHVPID